MSSHRATFRVESCKFRFESPVRDVNQSAEILSFGVFELDLTAEELRRKGMRVRLPRQAFQVLAMLLSRPGDLVTREQLKKRLWPTDTYGDYEHGLNAALNRVREALDDSAENPTFIETLPRRGYRFMVPVIRASREATETRVGTEAAPPLVLRDKQRNPSMRPLVLLTAVAAIILVVAASVFVYEGHRVAPAAAQRLLTRLTFDDGLQIGASWSPDGRFIAYSSNRGGKFDIWVQQISGGDALRITNQPGQNWQPDWSPDGKYIAYRSEGEEGGLYYLPALGGLGLERKLASFGYHPRWSPDSSQILFETTQFGWLNRLYVVDLAGAPPREVLTQLTRDHHRSVMAGAWYPDGKRVTALINADPVPTFWTGPVSGGDAVPSEISQEILRQIGEVAADTIRSARIYEHEWATDFKFCWESSGRYIYFERTFRGARNIWRITVDPKTLRTIAMERVTTGPGLDTELALSPDGERLAFTEESEHIRAWLFPFDATHGRIMGSGRPITSFGVEAWLHTLSPDGKRLAFSRVRAGKWTLMESRLSDGLERPVATNDSYLRDYAQWSPDSSRLAYSRRNNATGESQIVEWNSQSRHEEPLTPPVQTAQKLFDWSRPTDALLISQENKDTGRSEIAVVPTLADSHATASARRTISDPFHDLYQSRFSPDGRWIVFEALPTGSGGFTSESAIFTSPADGGPWVRVTDGKHWDDKPHWSPDGKIIYFVSGRSGFFNVWGVRFDPERGKTAGDPFPVTTFDSPSQMVPQFIPTVALSLTQDRLVLTVAQVSGSIWVLER